MTSSCNWPIVKVFFFLIHAILELWLAPKLILLLSRDFFCIPPSSQKTKWNPTTTSFVRKRNLITDLFLAHRKLRRTPLSQWGTSRPESVLDPDLEKRTGARSSGPLEGAGYNISPYSNHLTLFKVLGVLGGEQSLPPRTPRTVKKVIGLNKGRFKLYKWFCKLRAGRRHYLCLWNTIHIILMLTKLAESLSNIITKCDGIITNCDSLVYYKVRWTVITNCDSFFITKCDTVYCK